MAATQIHGGRQILDGTIKGAEIASDAAIHNSKLDLSSISQSVILRHANGVLIEPGGGTDEGQIRIRRNVVANPATSLFRLIVPAATDELTVERNTAAGGDFGTKVTHMSFRDDRILMAVPTLRLENVETSIQFRETDRALPGGLWRWIANGGDLRVDLNTALAGDFSTFATPIQITSGPQLQVNDGLLMSGAQSILRWIQDATTGILNTSLRRSVGRLVWRDGTGVDQTLAYTSELTAVDLGDVKTGIQITGLSTPGTSTVTPQGAAGTTTWGYRITAVGVDGTETVAGPEGATTTGNALLDATNFNRITWPAVAGAISYNVYRTTVGGMPSSTGKIGNTTQTTFDDTGLAAAGSVPSSDTTSALILKNTDAATGAKAWRLAAVSGVNSLLRLERDTSAAGDMSSPASVLDIMTSAIRPQIDLQIVGTRIVLDNNSHLLFGFGTAEGSMQAGGLYLDSTTVDGLFRGRLKFKSAQSGLVRNITYHEDLKVRETPTGAVDGVNAVFTLSQLPVAGLEQVYVNGLLQEAGATEDYTISSKTITFNTPPVTGDKIRVTYLFRSQ